MEIQSLSEIMQSHWVEIKTILISAIIGLAAMLAGLGLQMMISYFLERWRRQSKFRKYQAFLRHTYYKGPLRALLPAIFSALVLPAMGLSGNFAAGLRHALLVLIIAVVA